MNKLQIEQKEEFEKYALKYVGDYCHVNNCKNLKSYPSVLCKTHQNT